MYLPVEWELSKLHYLKYGYEISRATDPGGIYSDPDPNSKKKPDADLTLEMQPGSGSYV